jgi:hypothetical protein
VKCAERNQEADVDESTQAAFLPGEDAVDYEPPLVFDLGSVFEVTGGSSSGGGDSNGQGMY